MQHYDLCVSCFHWWPSSNLSVIIVTCLIFLNLLVKLGMRHSHTTPVICKTENEQQAVEKWVGHNVSTP